MVIALILTMRRISLIMLLLICFIGPGAHAQGDDRCCDSTKFSIPVEGKKVVTAPLFTGSNGDLISLKLSLQRGCYRVTGFALENFNPIDTGAVIGTLDDLAEFASKAAEDEPITFWYLTGHGWGEPTSIAFSDTLNSGTNVLSHENVDELTELKDLFTEESVIVLGTCRAAQGGEDSIAARLSEIWGVHVYAADMTVHHIRDHDSLGLIFCSGISSQQYFEFFPMVHFFKGKIAGDPDLDPMRSPIPKPLPKE